MYGNYGHPYSGPQSAYPQHYMPGQGQQGFPEVGGGILEIGGYGAGPWHMMNGAPEVGYYDIGASPWAGSNPYQYAPAGVRQPIAAMPQNPAPLGGLRLREREPTTERVLWLGFKSAAAIAAAAASNVTAQPQDTFAPRKVIIPATVAPNFEVADLKVGAVSQLSSVDPIPAEAFIPDAMSTDVRFDTAQISQTITFSVNNISAAAAVFRAAINGFVVRL